MTQEQVYKRLLPLTEQEQFYREYARTGSNPSARRSLLGGLDKDRAVRERWLIPELYSDAPRIDFADADFFDDAPRYHVHIARQSRFAPPYPVAYDLFCILFTLQGTGELRLLGDSLELRSGDICILAPNITHTLAVESEDDLVFRICLCGSTLQELLSDILQSDNIISAFFFNTLYTGQTTGYLMFSTGDDPVIRQQILAMYGEQAEKDVYSNILINHSLILLLIRLVREYGETAKIPRAVQNSDERYQLLYYLMNNFLDLTLSDVAAHYHFNVSYCSQYIKRITGKTFSQLMKIFRMRKACELLSGSEMSIHEISETLGYANPESFMLAFKNEMKLTPTQYRRRH